MPWSPSFANVVADPRLDPYRGRAAALVEHGSVAGYVLVEADYTASCAGGILWWRRWEDPTEFAVVFTKIGDAEARTTAVAPADLDLFDVWAARGYDDNGRVLNVAWLDDAESQRVHEEVFAHQH